MSIIALLSITRPSQRDVLARKLSSSSLTASVFSWERRNWSYWNGNSWRRVGENDPAIPSDGQVDLLLWHTGDDLPTNTPGGASFNNCVEFSSAGLNQPKDPAHELIRDAFPDSAPGQDACPLDDDDIRQLLDWAGGTRSEPPDICLGRPKATALHLALGLLCEAYLLAGRGAGEASLPENSDLAVRLPPGAEIPDAEATWEEVRQPRWWRDVLGGTGPNSEKSEPELSALLDAIYRPVPEGSAGIVHSDLARDAYLRLHPAGRSE